MFGKIVNIRFVATEIHLCIQVAGKHNGLRPQWMLKLECYSLTFLTFAYVTYQDLRRDRSLRDQTVIVVRAPSGTKLEVPDPQEVSSCGLHLLSHSSHLHNGIILQ